jgi:hypothetical protein
LRRFAGGTQLPHAETIADAAAQVNGTMDFVHPTPLRVHPGGADEISPRGAEVRWAAC